jgi:hypothetical protein
MIKNKVKLYIYIMFLQYAAIQFTLTKKQQNTKSPLWGLGGYPDQRYSKHYFTGSERVVSKMGTTKADIFNVGGLPVAPTPGTPTLTEIQQQQITDLYQYLNQNKTTQKVKVQIKKYTPQNNSKTQEVQNAPLVEMFYYHHDHLGTATFLTDVDGNPYQFFLNLPFGETFVEQHSFAGEYTNRYKFNEGGA